MAKRELSRFDRQNEAMRHVNILTIAEYFGINLRVGRNGLFFLEGEKGASLKIDIRKNLFYYHGESFDFSTPLAYKAASGSFSSEESTVRHDPTRGGDAIDFAVFAIYHTRHTLINPRTEEGMSVLSNEFARISPSIDHLVSSELAKSFANRHSAPAERGRQNSPFGNAIQGDGQSLNQHQYTSKQVSSEDEDLIGTITTKSLHPFWYNGYFFFCVEQFIQWAKASLCQDTDATNAILRIGEEFKKKYTINKEDGASENWFDQIDLSSVENMSLSIELATRAQKIGERVNVVDNMSEVWEKEDRPAAIAIGTHLILQGSPDLIKELLRAENSDLQNLSEKAQRPEDAEFYRTLIMEKDFLKSNGYDDYGVDGKHAKVLEVTKGLQDQKHIDYLAKERGIPERYAGNFYEVKYVWCSKDNPDGENETPRTAIATPTIDGNWNLLIHYKKKYNVCRDASGAEILVEQKKYNEHTHGPITRVSFETEKIKNSTGQNVTIFDKDYNFVINREFTPTSKSIIVVEGQLNAVSLLAIQGKDTPGTCDILTLNSVSNLSRALSFMKQYSTVILFLDNDKAGQTATREAATYLLRNGIRVFDGRPQFVEGRPLQQLSLKDNEETAGLINRSTLMIGSGQSAVPFSEYWKNVPTEINDLNDLLMKTARKSKLAANQTNNHEVQNVSIKQGR